MLIEQNTLPVRHRASASLRAPLPAATLYGAGPPLLSSPAVSGPIAISVFLWAFVCLSTNVKVAALPYIDWYCCLPVLLWAVGHFKPDHIFVRSLFLLAILHGGILADNLPVAFVWITKLALIFVTLASFQRVPSVNRILWYALIVSLYGNVACLALGELGLTFFADVVTSEGRVGTLLNLPGSLWHIGMSLIFNYSYLLVTTPKHRLWNLVSLLACLYIIFSDAGRTAVLFILMLPCVLFWVFFREGRIARVVPLAVCVVLSVVVMFSVLELEESTAITRIMPMLTGQTQDAGGFEAFDSYRFQMLQKAKDLIYEHPILGNGVLSAVIKINLQDIEFMTVHNAYLQIWADLGLLGLATFLVIVFGWIIEAPAWLRKIVELHDPRLKARYYNAMFTLLWFGLSLLFHPFSSEWSEWILFLAPNCLLMNLRSLAPYQAKSAG